jgi:hypothetical protein
MHVRVGPKDTHATMLATVSVSPLYCLYAKYPLYSFAAACNNRADCALLP